MKRSECKWNQIWECKVKFTNLQKTDQTENITFF